MKRPLLSAVAASLLAFPAHGFEAVSQKDYTAFAGCLAEQFGAYQLLVQNVDDWHSVLGGQAADMQGDIDSLQSIANDMLELTSYMAELLDELEHPAYGLDGDAAEAKFELAMGRYDALLALPREMRMDHVLSDDFELEMSPLCSTIGDRIEAAVLTNLETGAVAWED